MPHFIEVTKFNVINRWHIKPLIIRHSIKASFLQSHIKQFKILQSIKVNSRDVARNKLSNLKEAVLLPQTLTNT